MSGHTPGIIVAERSPSGQCWNVCSEHKKPHPADWCPSLHTFGAIGLNEADAKRMALCWNCHDTLLAACEAALPWLLRDASFDITEQVTAAIKLAKGGA